MEEMLERKRVETSTKYRILVNYLKELVQVEEGYTRILSVEDVKKILRALEEVK